MHRQLKSLTKKLKINKTTIGCFMVVLAAVGFGSYGIWARNIGAEFDIYTQGWVRSLIVLAVLVPIGIATKQFRPIKKKDWGWMAMPILFGAFTQVPLFYAFNHMPIGTATLIYFALFLITSYSFGLVFMKEKMNRAKKAALILAMIGLSVTFGIELGVFSILALGLAALHGIASSGEVDATKKIAKKYSSLQISTLVWIGILITHLPAALITGETLTPITLNAAWISIAIHALVGLAAFWLIIEGFRRIDASIGGLLTLLEVIFAVLFGLLIFNEQIGVPTIIGGLFILIAATLPHIHIISRRRKASKNTAKESTGL